MSGLTADEAAYAMGFAGLSLDYDADQAARIVKGTDPVAGALLDEGSHVTPIFEDTEEPAQTQETKPQPETEPETDTSTAPVASSMSLQAASEAMVAMFIPMASPVSKENLR